MQKDDFFVLSFSLSLSTRMAHGPPPKRRAAPRGAHSPRSVGEICRHVPPGANRISSITEECDQEGGGRRHLGLSLKSGLLWAMGGAKTCTVYVRTEMTESALNLGPFPNWRIDVYPMRPLSFSLSLSLGLSLSLFLILLAMPLCVYIGKCLHIRVHLHVENVQEVSTTVVSMMRVYVLHRTAPEHRNPPNLNPKPSVMQSKTYQKYHPKITDGAAPTLHGSYPC